MLDLKGSNTIFIIYDDCVVTVLADGTEIVAAPQDNEDYRDTAERLGYGRDDAATMRMCRDHEITHSALASWLGLIESPTLRNVAEGLNSNAITNYEEEAVLAIQKFANKLGIDLVKVFDDSIKK